MQFVGLAIDFAVGSNKRRERERERDDGLSFFVKDCVGCGGADLVYYIIYYF